jgi:hypothetical protein
MKMKESMVKRSEEPMAKNIYPPKLPGESAMAYSAFQRFIAGGGAIRPEAMAGETGCAAVTLRKWYQKHHWLMRYQAMTAAQGEAVLQSTRQRAERALAEWAERKDQLRATEWMLHLALVEAGQRALELLGKGKGGRVGPSDVAKLLDLASRLGRLATGLATESTEVTGGVLGALHVDIEVALKKVYGQEKAARVVDLAPTQIEGGAAGGGRV